MIKGPVLLTGASGLLGTWLLRAAPSNVDVVALVHRTRVLDRPVVSADLRDPDAVHATFASVRPSLVLHAAYDRDATSIVDATRHVASAATAVGADLVYVSSDAVFSGDGVARDEHAATDPVWDYGRWKAQSEQIALELTTSAVVRLPLLVSLNPEDHVITKIRSGHESGEPTVWFDDEIRQPVLASEVAEAMWKLAALATADRGGIWHLPGPESLSRYEIAERVMTTLGLDKAAIAGTTTPAAANRPQHLNMRDDRARHVLDWSPSRILI